MLKRGGKRKNVSSLLENYLKDHKTIRKTEKLEFKKKAKKEFQKPELSAEKSEIGQNQTWEMCEQSSIKSGWYFYLKKSEKQSQSLHRTS